jgi:PAS domain S-box-containing protein
MDIRDTETRALILEDEPTDAELVQRNLAKSGRPFSTRIARNRASFVQALRDFNPDIVLCDYKLPDFDGLSALKLAREKDPDLPVIMVTGALGDEAAVELVKAGAVDYVLKDRLARLGFAVERALQAAAETRSRQVAERRLRQSALEIEELYNHAPCGYHSVDATGLFLQINDTWLGWLGYSRQEVVGKKRFADLLPPADRIMHEGRFATFLQSGIVRDVDYVMVRKDGSTFPIRLNAAAIKDAKGRFVRSSATVIDMTARKAAEDALRDSEERFRNLVESTKDVIWEVDAQSSYTYISPACREVFGYEPAEVLGKTPFDFMSPQEAERNRALFTPIVAQKRPYSLVENVVLRKDGTEVMLETSGVPIVDHEGRLTGYRGIDRDVTARKRAEEAARESETRYQSLVAALSEGIVLQGADGAILACNESAERILGLTRDQMAGRTSMDPRWRSTREDGTPFPGEEHPAMATLSTGKPLGGVIMGVVKPDGDQRWISINSAPLFRPPEERPYAVVTSFTDITDRRRAEERLRIANLIVENSSTLLYRTALDGEEKLSFISANASRFGYAPESLIGRRVSEFIHPDDVERVRKINLEMIGTGKDQATAEYRLRAVDGTYRMLEDRTRLVRGPGGEPLGTEGVLVDITERKAAEEAREQLAAVVESSRSGIIAVDLDGIVTSWNEGATRIYGYGAEEMVGRPITTVGSPVPRMEIRDHLARIERGEEPATVETVRKRKDGRWVDILQTFSPVRDAMGKTIGASSIILDITERKQAERALQRTTRALKTLSHANEALVRATSQERLFEEMCRVIVEVGGYHTAWVGIAGPAPGKIVQPVARAGRGADIFDRITVTWGDDELGQGTVGTAIRSGEAQCSRDLTHDPRTAPWWKEAAESGLASNLALPLREDSRVLGVLAIYAAELDAFGPEERQLLGELASDISFGVTALKTRADREAALERLEQSMEETVQAVATTVEFRDAYTAGHQRRVSRIAEAIAAEMGLPAERIHGLRLASTVHDLGKINIPAEILSKPGKLTDLEYELIKTHPQVGYDILKPVQFPWPIAQMVLQHHERLDGSGYPNGLKGDAILPEARILAVADVVEAMMSHRPFRPALGLDAALTEIRRGSGKLYDPAVVDACLKVMRSGRLDLEQA